MNYAMKHIPTYQFLYKKNGKTLVGGFTFTAGDDVVEKADKLTAKLGGEFWWGGGVIL